MVNLVAVFALHSAVNMCDGSELRKPISQLEYQPFTPKVGEFAIETHHHHHHRYDGWLQPHELYYKL